MRNYFSLWGIEVILDLGPAGFRWNSYFAQNRDDAQEILNSQSSSPQFVSSVGPINVWFPLDKENVIEFLNGVANAGYPLAGSSLLSAQATASFITNDGINKTPRQGWTDGAGVQREPTPSDKRTNKNTQIGNVSTPGVFSAVQNLTDFANSLLKTKDLELVRIGGIILQQLGLAFSGAKTIVAVLRFLQPFLDQAHAIIDARP